MTNITKPIIRGHGPVRRHGRRALGAMLTPARHRLLLKITGRPRLGYLNEIFEDARFIHLVRDGRAVAASLLHVDFWRGWYGPQGWRAGLLSPEDQALSEAYDRSFVALAGLEWRIQMGAMEAARRAVDPSRLMEIRYEDFCERPKETFREVLEFFELRSSPVLDAHVAATPIRNTSNDALTAAQQHILEDLLRDDLRRYGYGAPEEAEQLRGTVAR
jgi:omega-hydroxy-beta-dihydromenaquinone-9 sulfotransferase